MRSRLILAMALCLFGGATIVRSQVTTGTINVEVQDTSGAVMSGANIVLRHITSGQERVGITSETGSFRAAFMPVGEYSIRVTHPGFVTKAL